jgi:DedD protein
MGLLSKITGSQAETADDVQQARTRARRRLIGAVLLLGVGLIGFPLLFETQPRPIPVDIPIRIPPKDNVPALVLPAPKPVAPAASPAAAAGVITETAAEAGRELAPAPSEPPKVAAAAAAPPPAAASKPGAEAARAKALLEGAAVAKAPAVAADEGTGRFVVQVGAYADASAARDTRAKVERLGLKTYTQVVDTDAGKRIRVRVGPFVSRDEAAKAAGRIKSAGLPTALLSL